MPRLKAMDGLIDEGVTSFKLFMAYRACSTATTPPILKAMQKSAASAGR
jgi:dihydropyrimidinase